MGEFSWMFADRENKRALKFMGHGYVACPDGSFIEEMSYDGYGHFGGKDIYDLVVDWNRELLNASMLRRPKREMYVPGADGEKSFHRAVQACEREEDCLNDWHSGLISEKEMVKRYGEEWKRCLGIDISCYDDQNCALPYPIKIVSDVTIPYDQLPASLGDENQGL